MSGNESEKPRLRATVPIAHVPGDTILTSTMILGSHEYNDTRSLKLTTF